MFTSSIYVLSLAALLCHAFSSSHNDTVTTMKTDTPRAEALAGDAAELDQADVPVFPQRSDAVYFVVAAVGGARAWGRILGRTLLEMGPPFTSPQGPPLRPIYVDLPQNGRFSSRLLTSLCQKIENQPLTGIIVIGEGQSARATALSGSAMKVPVLWAKGGTASLNGLHQEIQTPFQAMLQPSSKEILEAIRALFLQTHWHSFFIMSDVEASMILGGNEGAPLRDPPLVPTILPLPANNDDVFRQLAQVSKSTRGVVLLLCNLLSARRIMAQAQRLNMVGGHFIWLWADSSATTEFYDVTQPSEVELSEKLANENPEFSAAIRRESDSWYDPVGGILSHHLDDLEERRMDFDEYGVRKKQQKEKSRHLPRQFGGQILGVNIDEGVKPVRRKRNEVHEEITDQPSTESTENVDEETELNPVHNDNKDEVAASSDGVASDGSKLKRNPYLQHNSTSHVLFHHFNDFPVGFLALRPIKMAVDRHFVRSVVRLFAHTWAITELQAGSLKSDGGVLDTLTSRTRPSSRGSKRPQRRKRSSGKTREVNSSFTSRTLTNHSDLSVDLGDKLMRENTSGLNVNHTSNKSLRLNSDTKVSRSKRQNTWWSVNSTEAPPPPTPAATRPRINTTLAVEKTGRKISAPQYRAGCFGTSGKIDIRRAEHFAKILRQNTRLAMSGNFVIDGTMEKPLITHFELLNLVPNEMKLKRSPEYRTERESELPDDGSRKWRRVGLVSGTSVHLDTIVWPGGDIVVSGLSARPRSVFRVVTALAPPFVMESDLDEDGLCLRGLYCHRLSTTGSHNLTLMFNEIETRNRLVKGASEHRSHYTSQTTSQNHQNEANYKTKCCYGLSMDLLENIATELGFEFHLYIVRDEVYGTRLPPRKPWGLPKSPSALSNQMAEGTTSDKLTIEEDTSEDFEKKYRLNSNTDPNNIFGRKYQKNFFNTAGQRLDHEGEFDPVNIRSQTERHNFRVDQWNGIIGDLMAGSADMSFAALSVSKVRAEAIDFSAPYFHSGVSLLAAPKTKSDIPLLAFLLPFSPELWIAIFTSLNITAIAVAVYEWLSPFGLNPWGRQRSKNFSMSSALWVMWGLLCGHLVAFKAPKSWPNKFLINVWGGFSVIFVASYTANIAALIAGLFFHNAANKYDASLLTQRVGAPIASAAETYIQKNDKHLWEHMRKYSLQSVEDGIRGLKNGSLDLLMADSPILDYYRATDHGCNLQRIGETYVEDTYAIGMTKGFPLRDSISALIAKYSSNGYLDILTEKWYGGLPCFKLGIEIAQPRPLGVAAVAGVFLLLGLGMILGCLILIFEHWFYKYALPILRHKPKGTVWKSRNIMFFSQKLYRFINCVELVSPHHAARELVHTLRQGQIASLFQKSIKRKEDEQRRRRKSKAQFFEMIQEIRRINFLSRVQQEERETAPLPAVQEIGSNLELAAAAAHEAQSKPPKISPKPKLFSKKESRSRSNSSGLNVRRFSTDSILGERMDTIGRRLSRDISYSPPDLGHRFETFGKGLGSLSASKFDAYSSRKMSPDGKFDTFSGTRSSLPEEPEISGKKFTRGRTPLNLDVYEGRRSHDNLAEAMTPLKERLAPPICILEPESGVLRDRMHEELRQKYGGSTKSNQIRRSKSQQQDLSPSSSTTRSKNSLEVGGRSQQPTPSPRRTKRDLECTRTPKTPAKSNGKKFSLERLSREELMRLSHSSQDEIHEYLEKDIQSPEPP